MRREEALELVKSNLYELENLPEFNEDEEFVLEVINLSEDDIFELKMGQGLKSNPQFALKVFGSQPKGRFIEPSIFSKDVLNDKKVALKLAPDYSLEYFQNTFGSDVDVVKVAIESDAANIFFVNEVLKKDYTIATLFMQSVYREYDGVEEFYEDYEDYCIDESLYKELWAKEEDNELNKPEICISDDEEIELMIRFSIESSYENEEENIEDIQEFSASGTIEEAMKTIVEDSGGYDYDDEDYINYSAESDLIETIREIHSIRINSRKCLGKCFEKYSDIYQMILDAY